MNIQIRVNGKKLRARKGDFLLDVCRKNGIRVPTLCSLSGFAPTGACRLCVVEIEGHDDLVPACSFPIVEDIIVKTHSARVIRARKTIVELLLSSHPDDCMFCLKSSSCELQSLAIELSVNERRIRTSLSFSETDNTSPALSHHPGKCVLCGRCIRVCDELKVSALEFIDRGSKMEVGTVGGKGLDNSSCVACGQCLQVCPTGSLQEKNMVEDLLSLIQNPEEDVVALIDPAVYTALTDEVRIRSGKDISGLLIAALKTIGFEKVFSDAEAVDLSLVQAAEAWSKILKSKESSWYMSSSCAAWTHYIEQIRPEWINHMLPVNTPLMSFSRVFRKMQDQQIDRKNKRSKLVYITSCVASKAEIYRSNRLEDGKPLVDLALTTRELLQLLRLFGIQLYSLDPMASDRLVKGISYPNHLSSVSGGFLESLYRLFCTLGKAKKNSEVEKLRGPKDLKIVDLNIDGQDQSWIATDQFSEAINKINDIERGKGNPVLIEVMACPSGCIGGGGQPANQKSKPLKNRLKTIYDLDRSQTPISPEAYDDYRKLLEKLDPVEYNYREVNR